MKRENKKILQIMPVGAPILAVWDNDDGTTFKSPVLYLALVEDKGYDGEMFRYVACGSYCDKGFDLIEDDSNWLGCEYVGDNLSWAKEMEDRKRNRILRNSKK